MRFRFDAEALAEYLDAIRYYTTRSPQAAEGFVTRVEQAVRKICETPETWRRVDGDVRRFLPRRFPYGIYYTIETGGLIVIWAVMHLSRKPGYWKSRLR